MNGSLSDGNENSTDIFVLSTSTPDSPVQAGFLEQQGYRITFFSDSRQLFESLQSGKPNLLICDSVTLHDDAYELCRLTKTDPELWIVPVLIVTEASNLSDLLHVLDCNADNYISYPYDPPYLLSLIEGMLSTPVEPPTPEQIKTQFKIQHDDQLFVVTADRRRLLEFLLSSFEIAVSRTSDLAREREEIGRLSRSLEMAESRSREQAESITGMTATLRENDRDIRALQEESRSKDRRIEDLSTTVAQYEKQAESDRARLAETEENIIRMSREAEDQTHRYTGEITGLREELSTLSSTLAALQAEHQTTANALNAETTRREDTDKNLAETSARREDAEKAARALTLECEQLRVSLAAEKNRAQTAEYEVKSLLQAKTDAEQDLTRIINELKDTAKQQGSDLGRQKEELDESRNRILNLEIQIGNLKTEKDRAEAEFASRSEADAKKRAELESLLAGTRGSLEERDREIPVLRAELRSVADARDTAGRDLEALTVEFGSLKESLVQEKEARRAVEERFSTQVRENEAALLALQGEHRSAQNDLDEHRSTLSRVRYDLETAITTRSDLEESLDRANGRIGELEAELGRISAAGNDAAHQVRVLSGELEQARGDLAESQGICRESGAALDAVKQEKVRLSAALEEASSARRENERSMETLSARLRQSETELAGSRKIIRETGAALDAEKQEKERLSSSLDALTAARSDMETGIGEATARIRQLESELAAETITATHTAKQVRALSDELDQARAELESGRRIRHTFEESLTGERQEKERISADLRRVSEERTSLSASLAKEEQLRREAESERERLLRLLTTFEAVGKNQESSLSATIQELTKELADSRAQTGELAEKVTALTREKASADARIFALSAEIDQARTALADEWENHMNVQERLNEAEYLTAQARQPVVTGREPEKQEVKAVIVKVPDLPAEIPVQSLSPVPPAPAQRIPEVPVPAITKVDDLFEEEEGDPAAPSVTIVHESSSESLGADNIPALSPEVSDLSSGPVMDQDETMAERTTDVPSNDYLPDESSIAGEPEVVETGADTDGEVDPTVREDTEDDMPEPDVSQGHDDTWGSIPRGISFNRAQWFDLLRWAHHAGTLSQEQRMQIVRMGRLIQKGRRLTQKQEDQVREMISLVQAQGYRFS